MFKLLWVIFILSSAANVVASDHECSELGFKQAFSSVNMDRVIACFVYVEENSQHEGQLSRDPDGISMYSMADLGKPVLVYQFPYAGTKGRVNDAFVLSVGGMSGDLLFVIHSMEAPSSWDSISDVYDVSVMRLQDESLVHDKKLSRFFDLGGDIVGVQGGGSYIYPYKDRGSIEKVIRSQLFEVVRSSASVKGTIKGKAFLYEGDAEPVIQDASKMYLVKGDQVAVVDAMAGWCKVIYSAKAKILTMWVQCSSVKFNEG